MTCFFHYLTLFQAVLFLSLYQGVEAADITCFQGGKLGTGNKTYSPTLTGLPDAPFLNKTSINGQYCDCLFEPLPTNVNKTIPAGYKGWTGVNCRTSFEVCPNGDLVCYNGGKCVGEQIPFNITEKNGYTYYYYYNDTSIDNNNTRWFCDCRSESVEDDSFTDYAGVSCEYPATSYCGAQTLNRLIDDGVADVNGGTWFCTNGGTCTSSESDVDEKCTCKPNYFGPHCEYHKATAENITDDDVVFIPEVDEVCDLQCKNGGQCLFGVKDYSDAFDGDLQKYLGTNLNGMNCACPKGWTGLLCEIPMMVCGKDKSICLNGGICTPSRNSSDYYCDCSNVNPHGSANNNRWNSSRWNFTTWDDRLRHHDNWSFGGKSCHVPASTLCPVPTIVDNPLDYYCANGGTCPPISDYSTGYCTCPKGFTGPRCEYSDKSPLERNCTLPCQNDGKCFFGVKDYNSLEDLANISVSQGTNYFGMFCQCPAGYGGLLCDSAIELCSAREQFACFNKAKCTKNNGIRSCNCTAAGNGFQKQFAGNQCQFPASSWCEGKYRDPSTFCTNGGTCKTTMDKSSRFPGCDCLPGFFGDRCEIVVQAKVSTATGSSPTMPPASKPAPNQSSKNPSFQAAPLFIIAVIIGVLIGGLVLYRHHRSRQQRLVIAYPSNPSQDLNLAPEGPAQRGQSSNTVSSAFYSSRSAVSNAAFTNSSRSIDSKPGESRKDGDEMKEVEIL